MRARLVRPEFWGDSKVAKLPESVRLFYIGLWCVADDAGYIDWDLAKIAAELMPYSVMGTRERRAGKLAEALIEAGRVVILGCGRHAVIPTLERHRITGGNTSTRMAAEHQRICPTRDSGRVRKRLDVDTDASTDKSRSESLSPSLSLSDSPSPRRARTEKKNTEDRDSAIDRARRRLDDPNASDDVKQAARFALERLGA